MPFPDELAPAVNVVDYKPEWPAEFTHLADRLRAAVGDLAVFIDHVGSTSVPALTDYGQIKLPATGILLLSAEHWAHHTNWTPS